MAALCLTDFNRGSQRIVPSSNSPHTPTAIALFFPAISKAHPGKMVFIQNILLQLKQPVQSGGRKAAKATTEKVRPGG